jgi:predicted transcriptional regulator
LSEGPRDRLDILADIVEFLCLKGPQLQNRIMHACNLTHGQVRSCTSDLIQSKLITKDENTKKFEATALGVEFLKRWTEIFKLTS